MPTKQWYLDNYSRAVEMLQHAVDNHNCSPVLPRIKIGPNGNKEVRVAEAGNPSNTGVGTGVDNREAMASALEDFTGGV